jgi:hypothetical protein
MRSSLATALAVVFALASPVLAVAQEPVRSFDQLDTRLKPGDRVWVTDAAGREVEGKIQSLSPDALTLKGDGPRKFAASEVSAIRQRREDSLKNGALIGLAVGSALGATVCVGMASQDDGNLGWCASFLGAYGAMGAGIGVGIDAMIPGRKMVTYRAPGTPGVSGHARLSIAPVFTPRTKGLSLAVTF